MDGGGSTAAAPFLTAALSVGGVLLGIVFKEAISRAFEVKALMYRLDAQLSNTASELLNSDWASGILAGHAWNEKLQTALKEGGATAFLAAQKEMEDKFADALKNCDQPDAKLDEAILKHCKRAKEMPEMVFEQLMASLERVLDRIEDDKELVSDHEAARISWYTAHSIVELKGHLIGYVSQLITLFRMMRAGELPNNNEEFSVFRKKAHECAIKMVRLGKVLVSLRAYITRFRSKSLWTLSIQSLAKNY
jgi:hypothetical protein